MKYIKLFEQFNKNDWDPFGEEKFVSETQRRLDKMVGEQAYEVAMNQLDF